MFRKSDEIQAWIDAYLNEGNLDKDAISPFDLEFDFFYLSYMVGIAQGKKDTSKNKDLTKSFPQVYKERREVLATSLILAESKITAFKSQKEIKKLMELYFQSDSENRLNDKGIKLMNSYASAGSKELTKNISSSDTPVTFLLAAKKLIEDSFESNPKWNK